LYTWFTVKLGFDIFRRLDDGSPLWVTQVDSVAEAWTKVEVLRRRSPGQYFVRDAETGKAILADSHENRRGDLEQA
jgi:hypothetical protein